MHMTWVYFPEHSKLITYSKCTYTCVATHNKPSRFIFSNSNIRHVIASLVFQSRTATIQIQKNRGAIEIRFVSVSSHIPGSIVYFNIDFARSTRGENKLCVHGSYSVTLRKYYFLFPKIIEIIIAIDFFFLFLVRH